MVHQIEIYKSRDGKIELLVNLDKDTVWLNRHQLATLFDRDIKTLGKHLANLFNEGELDKDSVVAKIATTAGDGKTYQVEHYNLDVIISVGYRVKSKRGTQFRQWATQRLKDHLIKGYTINQKRLDQLQETIQLIKNGGKAENLSLTEAKGLLEIISVYTQSFVLLNRFDSNKLEVENLNETITYEIQFNG
jgi:hypothetical protein